MKRRGITFKIFIVTTILLVVSALILYLTLYFLLPPYYYHNKKAKLEAGVHTLVSQIEASKWDKAKDILKEFEHQYNASVMVQSEKNQIIFPNVVFLKDTDNAKITGSTMPPVVRDDTFNKMMPVSFVGDRERYRLMVTASLQPVDEAATVILTFLPYMVIVILLLSFVGAYVYSRLIARPLLGLNVMAKKMAMLDFSTDFDFKSNDEIGELASSLNKLSRNLQRSMEELHLANSQLTDDIKKKEEQEIQRREFVAMISHELKTPITAVSGQLEAMIHNIGPYRNRDKYLLQSHQITQEMEKLVHEILDISSLESQEFRPQIRTLNATLLLTNIIENYQYFCDTKKIKLVSDIAENVTLQADERLLSKAVSNVLSNAVKYTPKGEVVSVHLFKTLDGIQLDVMNSGTHIEANELPHLFKPFYRLEKSRSRTTGGSGLGLYIVQKVLEAHHAQYKLTNEANGVKFSMSFPRTWNDT
ncbi:HAMP domain-containing histidine kinase [Paenibacillus sp. ACRRX]|uniref:sensor histidine kinase n=1 Tax=Paenibacillus sp. ACRRX TaxID=2918206 RepID=UPI001EF532BB|nr:HAMP domain-containing sensor histidine kinase [Paenibacillus sp. ACRRX]MCG7409294.1 HAMP domain-containing histidine kinase [Paenibacillus sp. ACRRX]